MPINNDALRAQLANRSQSPGWGNSAAGGAPPAGGPQGVVDVSSDGITWSPVTRFLAGGGVSFSVTDGEATLDVGFPWFNVKTQFGATGNGLVDDTAEIQAALDACVNGGVVYLPRGKYVLSSQLSATHNNTIIIGDGCGLSVLCTRTSWSPGNAAIHVGDNATRLSGIKITNIGINGDPRFTGASALDVRWFRHGIRLDHCHMPILDNVTIDHCEDYGLTSSNLTSGTNWGPDQAMISRLKVTTCGLGIYIHHGHSWHLDTGLVDFCALGGIDIADINGVLVTGYDIESNDRAGVINHNSRNVVLDKCTFEENGKSLSPSNDEHVHIWTGEYSKSQTIAIGCFFNADGMRHMVRVDRGSFVERDCYIYASTDSASWTGGGSSYAVHVFSTDAWGADVDGFGVETWPTGFSGNVNIVSGERNRKRICGKSVTYRSTVPDFGGTWDVGDETRRSDATAGASPGWVCTTSGTTGTLNGGSTTGSISSGTSTLTVNSTTGIEAGVCLAIAGIATPARVTSVSGNTVTVWFNGGTAPSTVTGASVSYSAPVWSAQATLAA